MFQINKFLKFSLAVAVIVAFTSCNKDLEQFPDNPPPVTTGLSLAETLTATPSDSLFNRLVIKGGMQATLNNKALGYTLFVPSNSAIIASFGGTLALANATIAALSPAQAAGIVKYHMVPGNFPTSKIVHVLPNPNLQVPTDIILDPTNPLVRMTAFPSKNPSTGLYYYNNAPFTAADFQVNNSVMHHIAFVAGPPLRVLKDTIGRVANLAYFRAAIARADSGQTGLNRFDSLLNYAVTNMTVLAPNDAAFQTLIYGLVYNLAFQQSGGNVAFATAQANAAVALGPAIFSVPAFYSAIPASTVRGIMAYHLLASPNAAGAFQPNIRVFSVNIPTTANFFIKTLVNASVAVHPGVKAEVVFTGPIASSLKFYGYGSIPPAAPYTVAANVVGMDRHAVNGVFHILDRVLLPQ